MVAFEIIFAILTAGIGTAANAAAKSKHLVKASKTLQQASKLLRRKRLNTQSRVDLKPDNKASTPTNLDTQVDTKKLALEDKPKFDIDTFDFGAHLRKLIGDPPKDMPDPHAHHILFKKGLGQKQQELVKETQELLKKYDIDPIFGQENLTWAPNRIKGQHDIKALQQVVDKLKETDEMFGSRDEIIDALKELGEVAAKRR